MLNYIFWSHQGDIYHIVTSVRSRDHSEKLEVSNSLDISTVARYINMCMNFQHAHSTIEESRYSLWESRSACNQ